MSERTYVEQWNGGSISTIGYGCDDWRELNSGLSSNIVSQGTIFVGVLETPDRTRKRLVGIDVVRASVAAGGLATHARTIIAGNPISLPRYGVASDQTIPLPNPQPLLVFHRPALDPGDSSHFTIPCDAGKDHGTIDGWLKDDETVILEPHVTAPAPPSPGKSP